MIFEKRNTEQIEKGHNEVKMISQLRLKGPSIYDPFYNFGYKGDMIR